MAKAISSHVKSGPTSLICLLFLAGACLLVAAFSTPAVFAATLDAKGELKITCGGGRLTRHEFDKSVARNHYEFRGNCTVSTGEKVSNAYFDVSATWMATEKKATEQLRADLFRGGKYRTGSVVYSCPDDPWLNSNIVCTVTAKKGNIFEYVQPGNNTTITANFIDQAKKQSLKAEWTNATLILKAEAPVIELPVAGSSFHFIPAKVSLGIRHNPHYKLIFEFERRIHTKPNTPAAFFMKKTVVIDHQKTEKGVTTGVAHLTEAGQWRFRVRCSLPGAPWSEWRVFNVQ